MSVSKPVRVDILFFDVASGHRSAARALEMILQQDQPGWQVRCVNLADVFRGNRVVTSAFNWMLKRDRVVNLRGLVHLNFFVNDVVRSRTIASIARFWAASPPDVFISVTPIHNEVLYNSVRHTNPSAVCITIPVDFEEMMARYWFTPATKHHYLIGADTLIGQARRAGIDEAHIHRLSGMIIDPRFYAPIPSDLHEQARGLGLDPSLPTGLVAFGGQGSVSVRQIAYHLAEANIPLNMIFLCGRNRPLFNELTAWKSPYRKLVAGYNKQPPVLYHQLADFVIGKPGTMTITEAVVTGTPIIALESTGMAPLQRGNEAWVRATGVGMVVKNVGEIGQAVARILADRERYQTAAAQHASRGIFDASRIIASLARHDPAGE